MNQSLDNISISEIVTQTKHLELKARKLVNDSLQNNYKSSFRGLGMEFAEVRPYYPGDNVRDIDWNVTARMNEPFIKTFSEERELTTYFIIDISESGNFGSIQSKRRIMAELTALLGFTAFFANDKVGLILSSDIIEKTIPPMHNYSNILRIIRDVFYFQAKSPKTNLNKIFKRAYNLIKKKSIIFILSDFFDTDYEHALGTLAKKHEVIPLIIRDQLEKSFSYNSLFPIITELQDMETGKQKLVNLTNPSLTNNEEFSSDYKKIFKKLTLEYSEIDANSDYVKVLERLLHNHAHHR